MHEKSQQKERRVIKSRRQFRRSKYSSNSKTNREDSTLGSDSMHEQKRYRWTTYSSFIDTDVQISFHRWKKRAGTCYSSSKLYLLIWILLQLVRAVVCFANSVIIVNDITVCQIIFCFKFKEQYARIMVLGMEMLWNNISCTEEYFFNLQPFSLLSFFGRMIHVNRLTTPIIF